MNVTIGGYGLTVNRSNIFSCTNPYLQASIGFGYREIDAYLPFTRLTAPFAIQVWVLISTLLIISIVIILLTKKLTRQWRHFIVGGRKNRTPIVNMWATVLGIPISNSKMSNGGQFFGTFARTLSLLWIILWFVIRNSYQASLYTYLQSHRVSTAYDTIEKIRASNCKIFASPAAFNFIGGVFDRNR